MCSPIKQLAEAPFQQFNPLPPDSFSACISLEALGSTPGERAPMSFRHSRRYDTSTHMAVSMSVLASSVAMAAPCAMTLVRV